LAPSFVKTLKIPKLLSNSIGHYLTLKQIRDEKNNLSIVEKINELKNLIRCMKNKIRIIHGVETQRNANKIVNGLNLNKNNNNNNNISAMQACRIILRKLDGIKERFEIEKIIYDNGENDEILNLNNINEKIVEDNK
jgi:hypothetical protein